MPSKSVMFPPSERGLIICFLSDWDEIHDVFGDGHDYDWALVGDDEIDHEEERLKPDTKYQDVRHLSFSFNAY